MALSKKRQDNLLRHHEWLEGKKDLQVIYSKMIFVPIQELSDLINFSEFCDIVSPRAPFSVIELRSMLFSIYINKINEKLKHLTALITTLEGHQRRKSAPQEIKSLSKMIVSYCKGLGSDTIKVIKRNDKKWKKFFNKELPTIRKDLIAK